MATPRTNLRLVFQRREKITSLPLYYDGFLWKENTRDKVGENHVLAMTVWFTYCVSYSEVIDVLQKVHVIFKAIVWSIFIGRVLLI